MANAYVGVNIGIESLSTVDIYELIITMILIYALPMKSVKKLMILR
jgi:hypothetical protein